MASQEGEGISRSRRASPSCASSRDAHASREGLPFASNSRGAREATRSQQESSPGLSCSRVVLASSAGVSGSGASSRDASAESRATRATDSGVGSLVREWSARGAQDEAREADFARKSLCGDARDAASHPDSRSSRCLRLPDLRSSSSAQPPVADYFSSSLHSASRRGLPSSRDPAKDGPCSPATAASSISAESERQRVGCR